jgi:hypothetical protein
LWREEWESCFCFCCRRGWERDWCGERIKLTSYFVFLIKG